MASIEAWFETAILSILFIGVLGIIVQNFDFIYGTSNTLPFSDNSNASTKFITYQDTARTQIIGGEAQFDASQGITLKSSWGILKDAVSIVWGFVTGGWIEIIIGQLGLGYIGTLFATALRTLFFIGIVFGVLYALFKVST